MAAAVDIEPPPDQPDMPDDRPRPRLIPDVPVINPALDYAGGVVYIAQQMTIADDESDEKYSRPLVFTSTRDYFALPLIKKSNEIRVLDTGCAIDKTLAVSERRWSYAAILKWLSQGGQVNPWDLYHRIERIYIERVWFAEHGNYILLTLYTMLSYVYEVFNAVPYLHLTGKAGSGKSHLAYILAALAFNGHVELDPHEAGLFRTIEATRGLVVLDDQETGITNRSHSDNPFMTIVKTAYKKGGRVTRIERRGNDFVPQLFNIYAPVVIANVFGLEDILADRTIPILMREIPDDLKSSINTAPMLPQEKQPIIDDLFLMAMLHTQPIAEMSEGPTFHRNRTDEIFYPLTILALYLDSQAPDSSRSLSAELAAALNEKRHLRQFNRDNTPEELLRVALIDLLDMRGINEDWFSTREIEREYYKLHSSPPDWYNEKWLGRNIVKILRLGEKDKARRQEETVPRFDYKTGQEKEDMETKRFTYYYVRRSAL